MRRLLTENAQLRKLIGGMQIQAAAQANAAALARAPSSLMRAGAGSISPGSVYRGPWQEDGVWYIQYYTANLQPGPVVPYTGHV